MILLAVVVVLTCTLLIQYYQHYKRVKRMKKVAGNIPGPKPLPLFGNVLSLGNNSYDLFQTLKKLTEHYGPTMAIWIGSDLQIYIRDKEDMKVILSSNVHIKKSRMYDFFHEWIEKGLFTAYGHEWKRSRKIITPTFHFKMLENYIDVFNSNYNIMAELLHKEVGNDGFNIEPYLGNCSTDISCESALTVNFGVQINNKSAFSRNMFNILAGVAKRTYNFWLHPKTIFKLTKTGKLYKEGLDFMNNFVNQVISDKKKLLKEEFSEIEKEKDQEENNTGKKKSFIDLLLQEGTMKSDAYMTDEHLCHEVNTFISAGHGTITSTLGFLFYELAHNQEVQDNVVKEIEDHFGDDKRTPNYKDLQHFPYLEMVIKETMRLYPVTYLGRSLTEDVFLPSGYTIPAGSSIVFDWFHLHRDPTEFPEPDKFNPDNFLPEKCAQRHAFAYVPFSAGPRNCIGQKYAMQNMKSGIVQLLRNYKFLPSDKLPKVKLGYEILLHSVTGVNVCIQKRYDDTW